MMNVKFNIFEKMNWEVFLLDGVDENNLQEHLSINPYSEDHLHKIEPFYVSYSNIQRGLTDYKIYSNYEQKYIAAFEGLFKEFEIVGVRLLGDSVVYKEYFNFLSFKRDLEISLREDTRINFLIDELSIVINGNFDLNMSLYLYEEKKERIELLFDLLKRSGLFINIVK